MEDEFKIDGIEKIWPQMSRVYTEKKRKKREKRNRDEAHMHFKELTKAAEQAHFILIQKKSPYRFCIFQENDSIFIDVVIVDETGKIKEIYKRDITHDEFKSWITLIEEESGMIIDEKT